MLESKARATEFLAQGNVVVGDEEVKLSKIRIVKE